ncbi:MAG TPA: antibiotic biosynthesis monooxygenase family protein [Gaiellaceae bacterium]|nr:antibiotic biosynthesis monooxygenase family protein [Gaiellaceae bacterium]
MPAVWTHGTWTVQPGREDEFVALWERLAEAVMAELEVSEPPTLLRDRDRPNVFVSFGPWPDDEAVERFRSSEAFRSNVDDLRQLLESFEPRTMDEVWRG